jgi:two-component system sensor histidine kinase ChiS
MSVLFSDMRNFTSISENMSPQENFDFLNKYLETMSPAINKNNGFIDKYIGDAVMALFPTSAEDSVAAAVGMIDGLKVFNANRESGLGASVDMGVGIHIGQLILGTIGEDSRMETTVISDTVNASARLESLNKIYGTNILISGSVRDELNEKTKKFCRIVDRTQVKGKTEFLDVHEVFSHDNQATINLKFQNRDILRFIVDSFFEGNIAVAKNEFLKLEKHREVDPVIAFWKDRLEKA